MFSIARSYEIKTQDLLDFNSITDPTKLFLGQKIKIPADKKTNLCKKNVTSVLNTQNNLVEKKDNLNQPNQDIISKKDQKDVILNEQKKIIHTADYKNQTIDSGVKNMINIKSPIENAEILNTFGKEDNINSNGIVFYSKFRSKVMAASNGRVIYIGSDLKNYGLIVILSHQNGFVTTYSNLDEVSIKSGEYIVSGQILGYMGTSGGVKKPQLGFSIRKDGHIAINPLIFIKNNNG